MKTPLRGDFGHEYKIASHPRWITFPGYLAPLFQNEFSAKLSCENEFDLHENETVFGWGGGLHFHVHDNLVPRGFSLSYEWFRIKKTHFYTEARGNSEIAYQENLTV